MRRTKVCTVWGETPKTPATSSTVWPRATRDSTCASRAEGGLDRATAGTCAGGTGQASEARADAIACTGGSNRLALKNGSKLTGAINIFSAAEASIVAEDDGLVMNNAILLGGEGMVDTHGNACEVSGAVSAQAFWARLARARSPSRR